MGYEQKLNNNGGENGRDFLENLKTLIVKEEKEIKEKYGLSPETKIDKNNNGEWRFSVSPYQTLKDWQKEKEEGAKNIENLYDDKDLMKNDPYHQH